MASKQPLKATKTASKAPSPVKKAVAASKPAPAKKAVPVKKVVQAKASAPAKTTKAAIMPADKISKTAAKSIKAASTPAATKVAPVKKTASKVAAVKKPALKSDAKKTGEEVKKTATTEKTKPSTKPEVQEKAPAKKEAVSKKQVIVPVKPAVEPKATKSSSKKEEVSTKPAKPVVIPKTSTDKKVAYEPEFVKSVLDAPEQIISTGPIMRYSDADLTEFRELINKKLDAAKKELGYLQGLITRKDEMGGDESDNRYMTMEDGSMSMEREQLSQMASRQITFIDHLEKAIMRIENKTYGICRVTGKLIDKARLRAVPHATLSMEAKLGIAK